MILVRSFKKVFIFSVIFILFFEITSFVFTKFKLLIFNDTPNFYLGKKGNNTGINWRNEKSIWGAWHKKYFSEKHSSSCFDVIYKTNSYGARDDDFNIKNNKKTWILLGDSFAEGYGLNKNELFENISEKKKDLNILNFGSGGDFGPLQYYLVYKNLAKNFDHQGVIIFYFPQNDLTDNNFEIWYKNGWAKFNNNYRYRPYSAKVNQTYNFFYPKGAKKAEDFHYKRLENNKLKLFILNYTWSSNTLRTISYILNSFKIGMIKNKDNYLKKNYSSIKDFNIKALDENIFWINQILEDAKDKEILLFILPSKNDILRFNKEKNFSNFKKKFDSRINYNRNRDVKIVHLLDFLPKNSKKLFLECDDHYSFYGNLWLSEVFYKIQK